MMRKSTLLRFVKFLLVNALAFKVAPNIGFLRDDGVWVPQYHSLFIKNGQVLTWHGS